MKAETRKITPEVAKEFLKRNVINRPLNVPHLIKLTQQMRQGKWLFDGTPLKFTSDGRLLDGQHRLTALIDAEVTLEFIIITGVPSEAFKVMDTGKVRSASDSLSIEGVANAVLLADISRCILNFDSHKKLTRSHNRLIFISNSDVHDFAMSNEEQIKKSYEFCKKYKNPLIPKAKLIVFHMLMSRVNVESADLFISKFCTGLDLDSKNPIFLLRQKLIGDALSRKKIPADEKYALIARAWNLFRKNEEVSYIRIPENTELKFL